MTLKIHGFDDMHINDPKKPLKYNRTNKTSLSEQYSRFASDLLSSINKKADRHYENFNVEKGKLYTFIVETGGFDYNQFIELSKPEDQLKSLKEYLVPQGTPILSLGKEMRISNNGNGMKSPIFKFLHEGKICFLWIGDPELSEKPGDPKYGTGPTTQRFVSNDIIKPVDIAANNM